MKANKAWTLTLDGSEGDAHLAFDTRDALVGWMRDTADKIEQWNPEGTTP